VNDEPQFVTAEEAIARLGISRATFYNHARPLERFRRIGDRRVLYRVSDIAAMAGTQPVERPAATTSPVVYNPRRPRRQGAEKKTKG
jgi:predicted DNA-binding transcriptional regulator AlpA